MQPTSGEAVWYLCSGLSKPFFAELLAAFARETGAGRDRSIILVLDNAGDSVRGGGGNSAPVRVEGEVAIGSGG